MNPDMVILIAQILLKYGPEAARMVTSIFSNPAATVEDWEKVFQLSTKGYDDYVHPMGRMLTYTNHPNLIAAGHPVASAPNPNVVAK